MMLVDSNIIIYSINTASPKHEKSQSFLSTQTEKLVISQQNILESIRVLTHSKFSLPMKPQQAIQAVMNIAQTIDIITPDNQTLQIALTWIKKYNLNADQIFDAYLAATAVTNNIKIIATDNTKDFKSFLEIQLYNPFAQN